MGILINEIPGLFLLISSLPGSALRTHVDRSASLAMSTSVLKALPGKLDIKRHSPYLVFYNYNLEARLGKGIMADILALPEICKCIHN